MGKKSKKVSLSKKIDEIVDFYETQKEIFEHLAKNLLGNLLEDEDLKKLIHSYKHRAKDPERLRDKLCRKNEELEKIGKRFDINKDNLFLKIEDLAGVRLLHLHSNQMERIHPLIMKMLKEHNYKSLQPVAYTWDIEYEEFFNKIGIKTVKRGSYYTSVHYIVEPNRRTKMRCELQVRTLMEEVWGEVSHTINYPHETDSVPCQEQLKSLARFTSGCTRLVDSIFMSHDHHKGKKKVAKKKAKRKVAKP